MKRGFALLLAAIFALGCAGCGSTRDGTNEVPTERFVAQPTAQSASTGTTSMSVNRLTGRLTIRRPTLQTSQDIGDAGMWTIFVYLCGTDLESDGCGMASDDLREMIDGTENGGMRYVVETGGAYSWEHESVNAARLQRFLVQNGTLELVDDLPRTGMGREETFADFLEWGLRNYASEHMGVVLWNHGGGSITGVCFDETDDFDSLSLRELDAAFLSACGKTGRRFDFAGFDACLMGTLEAANILASYADYMIASQETEPGSGWSFDAIGRYLGANPQTDAGQLGIVVCDSYLEECREVDDDNLCTLSAIDLKKLDEFLVRFNEFARGMYDAGANTADCAAMIRGIQAADNFGGNNRSEGYTNMVDVGGVIAACRDYAPGADEALAALDAAVAYAVNGASHAGASGLSMYYPLSVQGSEELSIFADICPSPYYLSFVDRLGRGSVNGGETDDYDDGSFFDEGGDWSWGVSGEGEDGYWDYLNDYEQTGESPLITFATAPHLDENGSFWFQFDEDGYNYASDVCGVLYEVSPDGEDIIDLGETYDILGGWDDGRFADDFDGYWLSLPDGQNLATYIVEDAGDHVIYTSPITLNGADTNLRLRQDNYDGSVTIEGAWDGLDEYGAASRDIIKIEPGDVIVPRYYAYSIESWDELEYVGWEYVVTDETEIRYDVLEDGDYLFAFRIDDIFGDYLLTDFARFNVQDGEAYYYPED